MSKQNTSALSKMRKSQKRAEYIAREGVETGEVENDSEYEFDEFELMEPVYAIKDRVAEAPGVSNEPLQFSGKAMDRLMAAMELWREKMSSTEKK